MNKLIILFYVILAMSVLLNAVFIWGALTYKKIRSNTKFTNKPLLTLTWSIAGIGFILALIPIFMKVWTYDFEYIKSDPVFISILVFEILFLVAFLVLAYAFAFDFGIALDEEENRLQFFGQTVNIDKIIAIEEKKYSLKIVYEQGFKNIKKRVTVFTPNAKQFVKENLSNIVAENEKRRMEISQENNLVEELTNSEQES